MRSVITAKTMGNKSLKMRTKAVLYVSPPDSTDTIPTAASLLFFLPGCTTVGTALLATVMLAAANPPPLTDDVAALDALALEASKLARAKHGYEEAERALSRHPLAHEVQWRAARAAFFYAFVLGEADQKTRAKVGMRGYEVAQLAIASAPKRVEAHYWSACALGEFAQAAGVWAAIKEGVADKIRTGFERAIAIDPAYNEAGPLEGLGRYYFALPWPMRDVGRSRELLARGVKLAPQKLRLQAYYADALAADGEHAEALAHYRACATGAARPHFELDVARWQAHCKAKLPASP
jgi:tetratricopeptide (TPR) repeat protein